MVDRFLCDGPCKATSMHAQPSVRKRLTPSSSKSTRWCGGVAFADGLDIVCQCAVIRARLLACRKSIQHVI